MLLRVLFFRDPYQPETWIAQALEHDIAAYGPDMNLAKVAFERTVSGYIRLAQQQNCEPFAALPQAPDVFWERWLRATAAKNPQAEPIPSIPGHLLSAVTDESVSPTH